MSVIAKMQIQAVTPFGVGQSLDLGCVASNETMANYAGSEEDKLFSKASPSGSMRLNQPAGFILGKPYHEPGQEPDTFYVMVLFGDEIDDQSFKGAYAVVEARCASVTDYGGTSKEVRFHDASSKTSRTRGIDRLNWKMMVDNPGAQVQFKPDTPCVIAFYPTTNFDRDQAIAAAHAGPE